MKAANGRISSKPYGHVTVQADGKLLTTLKIIWPKLLSFLFPFLIKLSTLYFPHFQFLL